MAIGSGNGTWFSAMITVLVLALIALGVAVAFRVLEFVVDVIGAMIVVLIGIIVVRRWLGRRGG